MIPFGYNNDETIDFIKKVNNISKKIESVVPYNELRKIDKEELFTTIKLFYRDIFPNISIDLEKILENDAKGYIDKSSIIHKKISHRIKYIFTKEEKESISNNDLSSNIYLNGTINDYFTLAREYIHLIGYYNDKMSNTNSNLLEVESFYVEKLLEDYLLENNIINEDEVNNLEKLRVNKLYDSVKYCNEVINGRESDTEKFNKSMQIIYGELLSNELFEIYSSGEERAIEVFETYMTHKSTYDNMVMFMDLFILDNSMILDDYIKHIEELSEIPIMEINYNNKDRIKGLKSLKMRIFNKGDKHNGKKRI